MNYYERHIGDYLKDTTHLSLLEHGVYCRLLDVYYTREEPIPQDQAQRLIGARSREEKAALGAVLEEFFTLVDGLWCQKRCDEVIAEHHEFIGRQRSNAAKRWDSHRNATAMPPHRSGKRLAIPPTPTPTPTPTPDPKSRSSQAPGVGTPSEGAESTHTPDARSTWLRCRAEYPAGLWEGPKEILAERAIGRLLDDGESAAVLVAAARSYHEQQTALGKVGTGFVRGPEKFYGEGFWRGPFPLPQASSTKPASLSIDELKAKYPCPELDRVGS